MDLFQIMPFLVGAVFVLVIGSIIFKAGSGVAEWSRNNGMPIKRKQAVVLGKRVDVTRHSRSNFHHGHHDHTHQDSSLSTIEKYIVTFEEVEDGERHAFAVKQRLYDTVFEGDIGRLSYQGTRFKGFALERS